MKLADRHSVGAGRIAFDMGLVVVSVLLALALGNWREDHEKRALTHKVLVALSEEIDANREAINKMLDYQDRMAAAFRESSLLYQKTGEFRFPEEAKARTAVIRFSRAAYDSALVTQVLTGVSVDTLLKLSALYGAQDAYYDLQRTYAGATVQTDFNDGARYLRLLSNEYVQLAESERRMLPALDAAASVVRREAGLPAAAREAAAKTS